MDESKVFAFFHGIVTDASQNKRGLIVAIEGYAFSATLKSTDSVDPPSPKRVFQRLDELALLNSTFHDTELEKLSEDALMPAYGTIDVNEPTPEAYALKCGYARDRAIAYNKLKWATFGMKKVEGDDQEGEAMEDVYKQQEALKEQLAEIEQMIFANENPKEDTAEYNAAKRREFAQCGVHDRTLTLADNGAAVEVTFNQMHALVDDKANRTEGGITEEIGDNAFGRKAVSERDAKLGTEKFVSIVFPPHSHEVLVAAGVSQGGVRVSETQRCFPAWICIHGQTGAIEKLPSTKPTPFPNSMMVPCATTVLVEIASLLYEDNVYNPVLIQHEL